MLSYIEGSNQIEWLQFFKTNSRGYAVYQIENWHEQFDISMELSHCDGDNTSMMLADTIYMTITLKYKKYNSLVASVFIGYIFK